MGSFVGRQRERALLGEAVAQLEQKLGGFFLVEGDAGAGKTALVELVLSSTEVRVLRASARRSTGEPYGPLRTALEGYLHRSPDRTVQDLAPVAPSLALVLRGLQPVSRAVPAEIPSDLRRVFEGLAEHSPTILFIDDLQWADTATVTVLGDWAAPLPDLPLLVIGSYRSDELPRQHPLRRLRAELRQAPGGMRRHVRLTPLSSGESALLVRHVLGDGVAAEILATVERRAHGLPFYLVELATAIAQAVDDGQDVAAAEVIPESVQDAVVLRVARLSEPARALAEIASAGPPVPLAVLTELAVHEGAVEELLDCGLLVELANHAGRANEAAFRHALVGEALYAATPWPRRRRHHAALAHALEARGAAPAIVAGHWSKAHEPGRARPLLVAAAEAACEVYAYRDAKNAIDQALALWPAGEDDAGRLLLMDRLGECAERCGEIADAARAWEEVATARRSEGEHEALARVQRRLAGVYELANDWPRALSARVVAAEEFARTGQAAEAASERLSAAAHLQTAGDLTGALQLVNRAWKEIDTATLDAASSPAPGPVGLRARAMALEGYIRASMGEGTAGVELTRDALDLALGADLEAVTAEAYALHAYALEQATDYLAGLDALNNALTFCRSRGLDSDAHVCMACLTPALRHTGHWERVLEIGREILAREDAPEVARMVAAGELGLVLSNQGKAATARRHLARAAAFSVVHELFPLEIETHWGLARINELNGDGDAAATRLRQLSSRCLDREELHYSVAALRWASSFFGRHGLAGDLGLCTDVLARIADATGTAEATAALAHALGESALLEGNARRAADQFERALELLKPIPVPPEVAETQVRAAVAWAAAGGRDKAVERLVSAYHMARGLGAHPLAVVAVQELNALGEDVQRRLGRGAVRHGDPSGLTPREREVLHLVAAGLTNREIAGELFLSPRTVDMHVRNMLAKLGCGTRTQAARRAGELAIVDKARF